MRYPFLEAFSDLGREARHALRRLRAHPTFTFTAVFSLALGIGANSAIFSVLDGLFLHPPAVDRPGELLRVFSIAPGGGEILVSLDDYTDLAERARRLAGVAAEKDMIVSLRDGGASQFVSARVVSENYFGVLRPAFAEGRAFAPSDFAPSGPWPAVISEAFWKRQFEGRPQVAGRTVLVEGSAFRIAGVVGERFRGTDGYGAADIYLPIHAWKLIDTTNRDYQARDARILTLFARPAPAATLKQVQGELSLLAEQLARSYPETNKGVGMRAVPDAACRLRSAGTFGWLLAIVIAAILAMSCVNVANLLLAEADRRRKHFAIRLALGAGRGRLVGQLLAESLLLAAAGGAAGLGIAFLLVRFLPLWQPSMDGFAPTFAIDSRVAGFSLVLTLLTSVLFGLFPALRVSRPDVFPELKVAIAERSSGGGTRIRGALIVGQLAATLVLLAATGLMLCSLDNLVRADLGFPRKDLLTVWVHTGTRQEAKVQLLLEQWVERVRALPGVKAVAMGRRIPICPSVGGTWMEIQLPSSPLPVEQRTLSLSYNAVGVDFFRTLGIPLLEGRDFTRLDTADAARVAIVNETMAQRFWPQGALGQTLRIGAAGPAATVVGIARDTKVDSIEEPRAPYFYVPRTQDFRPFMTLVVEADREPLSLVKAIRAELARLDPELPSGRVITLKQALRLQSGYRTGVSALLSVLGAVGLTLAIVGLYGIVAYVANRRTRELGIRLALGAPAWRVGWLVLRQGVVLVALGIGLGVLASAATTRLLGHLLYDVQPMDPGSLAAGGALLVAVAIAGCLVPARRAARLQPAAILNEP